ncbi:MAG TPA: zinc-dependent metalloprotease [Blastocatellia bacterium]|nr:zinc-dependent metalloprotease [Blastocatellia bacterium]
MSSRSLSCQPARRAVTIGLLFSLVLINPNLTWAHSQDPGRSAGTIAVDEIQGQQPTAPAVPGQAQPGQPIPTPPPEKPFDEIVKDAEVIKGLFTLYRKDEKVYLELTPDQFDKIYLCSPTMESALGERGFFASMMLGEFVFTFHKLGKNVQFIQKNVNYRAEDRTPIQRAVARSFADSVLNSTPIASLPHPERKSVLIELNGIFLSDIALIGYALEATYRWPYRLDARNSALEMIKAFPQNVEIGSLLNFAIDRPPVPPIMPSPMPNVMPPPPLTPPDARSLQFRVRYSVSTLPETGYQPRLADDRVGHFLSMYQDFTSDNTDTPYVRYVTRWRLEKSDPNAQLSPPKEPIVFWLENTIPQKYRKALADGVLMWNKAFERVGFKDAIVVKQQPDDATWDPADVRYNTIRWFIATDAAFAIGPSRVNPFTGQIYDADIGFAESMTRFTREDYEDIIQPLAEPQPNGLSELLRWRPDPRHLCDYSRGAIQQSSFGHNLLLARGTLANGVDIEKYVNDFLTNIAAHEVGHTLGLRHNFRASTLNSFDNLQNTATTLEQGLTGSVMDYMPVNIAPQGTTQGQYWQTTLGTYDYWAIEYAYKPLAAGKPADELTELRKIASRVADPKLAYGTDEDSFGMSPIGLDPRTNQWDNSDDPLRYYTERIKLVQELWNGLETKAAKEGEGYQRLRRAFNNAFTEMAIAMLNSNKYIGGVYHHRDHVGDPNGRLPYEPVPAAKQRQAMELLKSYAFGPKAFNLPPNLLNKLAMDRFWDFQGNIFRAQRLDYPIHQQVVALQRALLDRLYNPIVLARLQDAEIKYANPRDAFTMSDMFEGVQDAIWSELKSGTPGQISSFRRAAQREHLKRLSRLVLRVDGSTPEDASTLARYGLTQLRGRIQQAITNGASLNTITRAHLQESAARIDETLKAQQQRTIN